jgi:acetyl-CoA carboxylase biotin carboxyl carrier protein
MDLRKLKKLIDLVQESGIAELEITEGEEKVRISRAGNAVQTAVMTMPQATTMMTAAPAAAAAAPAAAPETPGEPDAHVVKSPMVGPF